MKRVVSLAAAVVVLLVGWTSAPWADQAPVTVGILLLNQLLPQEGLRGHSPRSNVANPTRTQAGAATYDRAVSGSGVDRS